MTPASGPPGYKYLGRFKMISISPLKPFFSTASYGMLTANHSHVSLQRDVALKSRSNFNIAFVSRSPSLDLNSLPGPLKNTVPTGNSLLTANLTNILYIPIFL